MARRIGSIARTVYHAYEHPGYDLATNGESGLLRTLRGAHLWLVFDVGANHGDWTTLLHAHHPDANVHLFEAAEPTYVRLVENLKGRSKVHAHSHGLGAASGKMRFHYYPSQDGLTSAAWHMHQRPAEVMEGTIIRGDEWAAKHGITHADFLKVDVEGMELDVLRGFGALIEGGGFRFIQFEHHGGRTLLHDFYTFLEPAGYIIGKIYSRYVEFRAYDENLENGIGPNFLAAHRTESQWIAQLTAGWRR